VDQQPARGASVRPGASPPTAQPQAAYRGGTPLRERFPTIHYLRRKARTRLPRFAFEYADGGAGADLGIEHNWAALDAVELVPRYGVMPALPPIDTELFGRRFAGPFGIAPMGGPGIVWPGADALMARAAQAARVPYVLSTTGGITIEEAGRLAPDVYWQQLYRLPRNDHAIGLDLARRAADAGAHALVLTMDVPVRTVRPREVASGLGSPGFMRRPDAIAQVLRSPGWLRAFVRNGQPRFGNLRPYHERDGGGLDLVRFARREIGGAYTWDEVARFREAWRGPLVLKGILHPDDARRCIELGVDGIWVSNHGGRQLEGLPASIEALAGIVGAVDAARAADRVTVLMDSGVRSGTDVVRALAMGARAAFAGKAFLWGLGAAGEDGPRHVIDLLTDETRAALGQLGAHNPLDAVRIPARSPRASVERRASV
jgi:L-lactate dehydrogenase (cytochrome)